MPSIVDPLDDLRREIDRLDDALLDMLCERAAVVRRVSLVKNDRVAGRLAMRPAREAAILRRLVQRIDGRLPAPTIVAMWRELLAATTRLQTPFTATVYCPDARAGFWELARDHFGCLTPLMRAESSGNALRNLGTGAAQLAVLPMPDETDLWWRGLVHSQQPGLRIVGRLPFCVRPALEGLAAVIVAQLEPEPSGDDVTIFALEAALETSRARLFDALEQGGLPPRWLATVRDTQEAAALHLFEVPGFIGDREPRLTNALSTIRSQILRVVAVGGYARPLDGPEQG